MTSNTKASGVMAVTDGGDTAGLMVWFTYSGSVRHDDLLDAWAHAGRDVQEVPAPPGPSTSQLRAMNEEKGPRTLVRPLEGRKGLAIVREDAKEDDLDYAILAVSKVNPIGRLDVECEDDAMRERIVEAYNRHLFTELSTNDVSGWVSRKLLPTVDAISLRTNGGFYFIPNESLGEWNAMRDAIRGCSNHSFYSVPAMRTEDAIDAILSGLREEARTMADSMWNDIASGELGGRGLTTRGEEAQAMRDKVERYEASLGVSLADLQATLTKLRSTLGAASLKAEAGDDYTDLASVTDLL